jgi:hypothetical protein
MIPGNAARRADAPSFPVVSLRPAPEAFAPVPYVPRGGLTPDLCILMDALTLMYEAG